MRRLLFILVAISAGSGCAAGQGAPFHVYQSPLLQAEYHPAQRRNREFDPMTFGDHVAVDAVYASSELDAPKTSKTKVTPKPQPKAVVAVKATKAKTTPTLSVKAGSRVGARPQETGRKGPDIGWQPENAARYVVAVLAANKVEMTDVTAISDLYKSCKKQGKVHHTNAKIGDVVFFHNVFDANSDGRNNDWYTHVGIVDRVDSGTANVIGWAKGGVLETKLNVALARDASGQSGEINSQLRQPSSSDAPFTEYHAGQLFAGFCDVLGEKPNLVMIDGWSPESSER